MRFQHYLLTEKVSKQELFDLKNYANKLFNSLGLTVQWTSHFIKRLGGRDQDITKEELIRLFKETFRRHGKKINNLNVDAQRVVRDMKTDINMPFVIDWRPKTGFNLFVKTVIRKKDFKTSNPIFIIDQLEKFK